MSIMRRPRNLVCILLAMAWLTSVFEGPNPLHALAAAQEPGDGGDVPQPDATAPDGDDQPGAAMPEEAGDGGDEPKSTQRRRGTARKSRRPGSSSSAAAKQAKSRNSTTKRAAPAAPSISFARDVAPILVANCIGCHREGRPGLERGKLDLTTFEKLMRGTTGNEKVVIPGKPGESHMILRIKGEEEPRMPQGGNNNGLAGPVVARFESWLKAGAALDAGLDPKAPIESYAASLNEVERSNLAKLSPTDRGARITATGLERWKKANPDLKPEITPSPHFVLFSEMPKERAAATLKAMELEYATLRKLLGAGATEWVEKVSLYVFNDRKDYVEFVRTVKQGEVDAAESARADFSGSEPYVVAADPHDVPSKGASASRRKPRRRRDEDPDAEAAGRTLAGLLVEQMAEASVLADGKSPRWLAVGVGVVLASQVERRADYYQSLRKTAFEKCRQGWKTFAPQVLGGGGEGVSPDEFRAISYALVDCLTSPRFRELFPAAAAGLSKGGDKLDDVVKDVYGTTREVFLDVTGEWIAGAYGGFGDE